MRMGMNKENMPNQRDNYGVFQYERVAQIVSSDSKR